MGYASYIVARTYTEKVGLIDWKIGKRKKRGKKEKKKKKKEKKKKEKKTGKKNPVISGIRYVHRLIALNPPKTSSILPYAFLCEIRMNALLNH